MVAGTVPLAIGLCVAIAGGRNLRQGNRMLGVAELVSGLALAAQSAAFLWLSYAR